MKSATKAQIGLATQVAKDHNLDVTREQAIQMLEAVVSECGVQVLHSRDGGLYHALKRVAELLVANAHGKMDKPIFYTCPKCGRKWTEDEVEKIDREVITPNTCYDCGETIPS